MSYSNPTNENGKLLAGLLIGAAVGAALGLLFAPSKGSDTRRRFGQQSDDFVDKLKEKFRKAKNEFSEFEESEKGTPV